MDIRIIDMPIYYGCDVKGTDLAYKYLQKRNVEEKIKKHNIKNIQTISVEEDANKYDSDNKIKYIEPIMNSNKLLYNEVKNNINDTVSLIIGGDHSSVIGNIAAELDYYNGDVTVIWIDAHTDIHTDKTTPSGNVHGMPLGILMGLCDNRFDIGKHKLKSENLIYIGTRSYEKEELELIERENIKNYTYDYTLINGLNNTIKEIIKNVNTKYVHLSFDLDCFSYEEFKSVNVAYSKQYMTYDGFKIEEGKYILKELLNQLNVCGIDIVEYNPLMDKYNDIEIVEDIIKIIDENLK